MKANYFIFLGVLYLSACGSDSSKENADSSVRDTVHASIEVPIHSHTMPSPLQVASIFKSSGMGFVEGVTSQQKDYSKYTSNTSKSLNMGVYTSDLAYCVMNQQTQEALSYMKLSRQLAGQLGMASIFDSGSLHTRFEKNLGNEDSLTSILADLQMQTDIYLDEIEQQNTSLVIYSGAWIESMYIGSEVFSKSKNKNIGSKISEQMTILSNLINKFESVNSQDPVVIELVKDLKSVQEIYDNFDSVKKYISDEGSLGVLKINDSEVKELSKKIQEIRGRVIKG